MTFTTLTLTRHSDGQSLVLPVYADEVLADIGGERIPVMAPYLTRVGAVRAHKFTGCEVEQQVQFLYIDGNGITSAALDDYTYALA